MRAKTVGEADCIDLSQARGIVGIKNTRPDIRDEHDGLGGRWASREVY